MKRLGPSSPPQFTPWIVWSCGLAAAAAGVGGALLLANWLLPLGREGIWQWSLRKQALPLLPWTWPAAIALAVVGLAALDSLRLGRAPSRLSTTLLVLCLTICSGTLMVAFIVDDRDYPPRAAAAILGDASMGYYLQATKVSSVADYLREVEPRTSRGHVPERVATHPPGPVLYYRAARAWLSARPALMARLLRLQEDWSGDRGLAAGLLVARRVSTFGPDRSDLVIAFWAGLALTLLAPLVVPVAFWIGAVAADRRVGLTAAVPAACIPSVVCFSPSIETPGTLLAGLCVALWLWALRDKAWPPALACGALLMLGMFWTFGLLATAAVLFVIAAVGSLDTGRRRDLWAPVAAAAVGFLGLGAIGYLLPGYNTVTSMLASLATQRQVMEDTARPYLLSIPWNLYDFALFAGPSLVVMALFGTALSLSGSLRPRWIAGIGLGVIVTLAALVLLGSTRGEVGRIWVFLMPLMLVPAALPISGLRGWSLMLVGLLVLAGQLAMAMVVNSHLNLVAP